MKGEMRPLYEALYSKRLGRRLIQIESLNRDTGVTKSLCEMLYLYLYFLRIQ